jgi:C-terminal processing protease CtpA/Prc
MKLKTLSFLFVALSVWGVAQTKPAAPSLTAQEKQAVIDGLISALKGQYVFPELAAKVESELNAQRKLGTYDKVDDGSALANILNRQVGDICKDAHLRIRYSAEVLPARKDRETPSADEIHQQKRMTRYVNAGFQKVERLIGNVGYISFSNFFEPEVASRPMQAAMAFVADTNALIIDLRNNGGGSPETVRDFCSYFFDAKPVHLNDIYSRADNKTREFWTKATIEGKRYLDKDIYVLASNRTGSGAEEFCYNLQTLKRATIVGQRTWGGANPGGMVRLTDHFSAFIPTGRAINPYTMTNWEGTGVKPDVEAPSDDALRVAHLMIVKKLLESTKDAQEKEMLGKAIHDLETKDGKA